MMTTTKRARVKRGGRGLTPIEAAAELAKFVDASVPPPADPVPLDALADADLVRQVETRRANRWADSVRAWLDAKLAGTPQRLVDAAGEPVVGTWMADVLPAWMEAEWMARIVWPELYEEGPDLVAPRTAAEAEAYGLKVSRPHRKRGRHRTPTLPGCQGGFLVAPDHLCPNLRVSGHEFCPACESAINA